MSDSFDTHKLRSVKRDNHKVYFTESFACQVDPKDFNLYETEDELSGLGSEKNNLRIELAITQSQYRNDSLLVALIRKDMKGNIISIDTLGWQEFHFFAQNTNRIKKIMNSRINYEVSRMASLPPRVDAIKAAKKIIKQDDKKPEKE